MPSNYWCSLEINVHHGEISRKYGIRIGVFTSKYMYMLSNIVSLMLFVFLHNLSCSDSTLTVQHLRSVLQGVADWMGLGECLGVPWSRLNMMTGKESMLEEWLQNHPAPSWKLVAWALYRINSGQFTAHSSLKQLYGKHVTGMWLCAKIISGTIPCCINP